MSELQNHYYLLEQATKSFLTKSKQSPLLSSKLTSTSSELKYSSDDLVETLLEAEKEAKKNQSKYSFQQLIGTWQLCFITGTKKARSRAGIVLGSGKFIPKFLEIKIDYFPRSNASVEFGRVENTVRFGFLKLALSGPTKFITKKNILVFDFTQMAIKLFDRTLYQGYLFAGKKKEESFDLDKIKNQAFFTYFLIQNNLIAARGRGGGLAIWGKEEL